MPDDASVNLALVSLASLRHRLSSALCAILFIFVRRCWTFRKERLSN